MSRIRYLGIALLVVTMAWSYADTDGQMLVDVYTRGALWGIGATCFLIGSYARAHRLS